MPTNPFFLYANITPTVAHVSTQLTGFGSSAQMHANAATTAFQVGSTQQSYSAPYMTVTTSVSAESNSASVLSAPYVWTFTDTSNAYATQTATIILPSCSVIGQVVYQSYNPVTIGNATCDYIMAGNSATLVIQGAPPGEVWAVSIGGTYALGSMTAAANGTASYQVTTTVASGLPTLYSCQSALFNFNATIIFNYTTAVYGSELTGTAFSAAGIESTVAVWLGSGLLGNTTTTGGNWAYSLPTGMSPGSYTVTASAVPSLGGYAWGLANASCAVVISPIISAGLAWTTGPVPTGNSSSQTIIVGTTNSSQPIEVLNSSGTAIANVAVDGNGNFTIDLDYDPGPVNITLSQGGTTLPVSFFFTGPYSTWNFLTGLLNLLPTGPAWPKQRGSTMNSVLRWLVRVYTRNAGRAIDLLGETFPATPYELLPEWESTLGIVPTLGETIAQRQATVLAKFLAGGGQSVAYFIGFALNLGYVITITEFAPFKAGINKGGQVDYDTSAAFIWLINAPIAAEGTGFAGEMQSIAPAHTTLYFSYQ